MKKNLAFLILLLVLSGIAQQKKQEYSNLNESSFFFNKSVFDSAYFYAAKILESDKSISDSIFVESAIIAGLSLSELKQKDSLGYLTLAYNRAYLSKSIPLILKAEYGLAKDNFIKAFHLDALTYALRIDSIAKIHSVKNQTTVNALILRSEISRITFTPQAVNAAYDLMMEAKKMAQEIEDAELVNVVYMYLADLNGLRENYDEAKLYADLAFTYFKGENDVKRVSRIYWIYTSYYAVMDDLAKCEISHQERIAYLKDENDENELASALVAYGNFFRNYKNDCTKALELFTEARKIYEKTGEDKSDRYLRLIVGMAICHANTGNYQKAYRLYDEAYWLKVETSRNANQELTRILETKYQTEKKEQEIALLIAQNKLAEKEKTNQRYLFGGLLFLTLAAGGFLYYSYQNKLKTAQKLKELNALKSRFFANISHEFRTPLTLMKSPLQSVLETETSIEKTKKLQLVNQNANRMLNLVDQLLELSKVDSGSLKILIKRGNLETFINTLIDPFRFEADQKNLQFTSDIKISPKDQWFDRDILEKIISNLLSNALKYTPKNENVIFDSFTENNQLKITVQNSGVTLNKPETDKIFERFYQKNDTSPGAGIGLALVKELVDLYKGTVGVSNRENHLTFKVTLPLDKDHLKEVAIISEEQNENINMDVTPINEEDLPLLLVVDDNAAIREVISGLFSSNYKILQASSGKEAIKMAKKNVPDIIISDVMMPEMDGHELTNILKNDEVTSFIPIIMLTAKTGDEAHLQSLKSQADAFLTKPFNNRVLQATVEGLLAERAKLRERFSRELVLKPMEVIVNSADEKFLAKLQTIIDNKLQNSGFSVEEFADTLGMSRMQLHRKLKSLTGFSASEFIRKERLNLAAKLLKNNTLNVSEVAFAVGFNDADYFTKCFKEEFGLTPSQFSAQQ